MEKPVTVVIVEYRSAQRTAAYVQHFLQSMRSGHPFQFVIVDNSPGEENFTRLLAALLALPEAAERPAADPCGVPALCCVRELALGGVRILAARAAENLGYARGNNAGAALAAERLPAADFIVFSNNDLLFAPQTPFDSLLEPFAQDAQVAACGPALAGKDGRPQNPRRFLPLWRRYTLYAFLWPLNKLIRPLDAWLNDVYAAAAPARCDYLSGSFLVCERAKWESVGGFDEETFLYAEEPILGKRLQSRGWCMYCQTGVQAVHDHNQTIGRQWDNVQATLREYRSDRYFFAHYMGAGKASLWWADRAVDFLLFKKRALNLLLRR